MSGGHAVATLVFPSLKDSASKPVLSRIFSVAFTGVIGSLIWFGHRILYLRWSTQNKITGVSL